MDANRIIKFVILLAVVVLAAPFVMRLLPKPVSFERAKQAFERAGFTVTQYDMAPNPGQRAVAEADLTVNGINVALYQFDNEGKVVTATEYQKKDPGQAMVEQMHLAENMGAAVHKDAPSRAVRRGMFLMVATGQDARMVERIAEVFEKM